MNLDKYLNEKTSKDYELAGKKYTAKLTAETIIRLSAFDEKNTTTADQMILFLNVVFSEEEAKEILKNIKYTGIEILINDITKELDIDTNGKK